MDALFGALCTCVCRCVCLFVVIPSIVDTSPVCTHHSVYVCAPAGVVRVTQGGLIDTMVDERVQDCFCFGSERKVERSKEQKRQRRSHLSGVVVVAAVSRPYVRNCSVFWVLVTKYFVLFSLFC